ncbi:MAG: lamin tail domain-containing protein [Polyangiaceae bacterium]|nr:lamin tail domain-containing protein [Polyangiaceae bacterium]
MKKRQLAAWLVASGVAAVSGGGCGSERGNGETLGRESGALGSSTLVVSQVYGGGGNSGATYTNDFIEIFNRGTTSVSVSGWSVQYASATGSSWAVTNLSGSIAAGAYYLVEEAQGAGGTTALPAPDATGTISMSATSGKVALVSNQTKLTCSTSCVPGTSIVDFVGYGSSANSYEGSGPTATLSNTTAALRAGAGCTDTDSNASDFAAGTAAPRNSSTAHHACGSGGGSSSSSTQSSTSSSSHSSSSSSAGLPTLPSPTLPAVTLSTLEFGAFGDVRPNNPNDTAGYPDTILSAIFSGLTSLGVSFTVDVGDHCFQSTTSSGSYCHTQFVSHFMADMAAHYSGTLIPTMGNHEGCGTDAATTGNCTSWSSGLIHDYLVDIVEPTTGQSASPYYSLLAHGSWGTAKFVFVAANAWTSAQNTWLTSTLNVPTTYTFVLRHEPSNDTRAPGVTPSESLLASHHGAGTLTLSITGHTHLVQLPGGTQPYGDTYGATQAYETIIGNGGAPLDAGPYYGFVVFTRRARDGAIVGQAYEAMSSDGTTSLHDAADSKFRFAVNANGAANSSTSLP